MRKRTEYILVALAVLVVGLAAVLYFRGGSPSGNKSADNPLAGRSFYVDGERDIAKMADTYQAEGRQADATLLNKIARQPGTTWLTGPSDSDPQADDDIADVRRTSSQAAAQGKVAVYQLYAIPNRDACADYSKAGFTDNDAYLRWIDRIKGALQGDAVFSVEADAIAHMVENNCLSEQESQERYDVLKATLAKLDGARFVKATYLDAGHAEWFPNPDELAKALKRAGIDRARGVAVNVSAFVATDQVTEWSQRLVGSLGGNKGVLIDTSRNGQGVPSEDKTGEQRWCNPVGRGLGPAPSTDVNAEHIDAHMYIKNAGESDGSCFGNPPAGQFKVELALELARNARQ